MAKHKYAIGLDFGSESGRALLVEVSSGKELATAVYKYQNGVIDEFLPETRRHLPPDWALQDPEDYVRTFKRTIPAVLKESGVDPADVIGIGIDFTACTMLPVLTSTSSALPDSVPKSTPIAYLCLAMLVSLRPAWGMGL